MKSFPELRLTYGLTPPKATTAVERQREIAALQTARVNALGVDALVVYDLQDESSRTALARPFPFIETVDPADYAADHLRGVTVPKVVYQSVSRRDVPALRRSLQAIQARGHAVVLVGAPSKEGVSATTLSEAYALRSAEARQLPLGGIVIAERHEARGNEVDRMLTKLAQGCSFFISQTVYAVTSTKNLLSDLHHRCMRDGIAVPPVLVTLSPCGSLKTLEFMRWLGVSVPRWLENDLKHSADILQSSVRVSVNLFEELWSYASDKGIRLGANVESVSLGKAEIDASVEMTKQVQRILRR
ncbi:MAG: 5,10-methylenetetrahydrofolate reductase [Archangiaceae bacterium]|nr:5,10-methylenetetrahydrofolate reductase [Archangiaceae bacterium]